MHLPSGAIDAAVIASLAALIVRETFAFLKHRKNGNGNDVSKDLDRLHHELDGIKETLAAIKMEVILLSRTKGKPDE